MKAENTPQSHLGDQRGLGPREKLCFVQEFCAENCTPDQHGAVKPNTTANIRLARCFSPSLLPKDNKPDPQKAFTIPVGAGCQPTL